MAERLRVHIEQTNGQISRLDEIVDTLGTDSSGLKDMTLGLAGGLATATHSLAGDEILKNTFATTLSSISKSRPRSL